LKEPWEKTHKKMGFSPPEIASDCLYYGDTLKSLLAEAFLTMIQTTDH
jgi:hypothetical protein